MHSSDVSSAQESQLNQLPSPEVQLLRVGWDHADALCCVSHQPPVMIDEQMVQLHDAVSPVESVLTEQHDMYQLKGEVIGTKEE